jgi:hypothetical protein
LNNLEQRQTNIMPPPENTGSRSSRRPSRHDSGPKNDPRDGTRNIAKVTGEALCCDQYGTLTLIWEPKKPPSQSQSSSAARAKPGQAPQWLSLWEQSDKPGGEPTEVGDNSDLRKAVTDAARVALDLLGHKGSRVALARMGVDALKQWKIYRDTDDDYMPRWVDAFFRRVNREFVRVELSKRHANNGLFLPPHWNESTTQRRWEPRDAGTIFLNHFVCFAPALEKNFAQWLI